MKKEIILSSAIKHLDTLEEYKKLSAEIVGADAKNEPVYKWKREKLEELREEIESPPKDWLALQAELDAVQKRCSARTLDAIDIVRDVLQIKDRLHLTNKDLDGVYICSNYWSSSFPGTYRGNPESTHYSAYFHGGKWRVCRIYRSDATFQRWKITLTDEAKKKIIQNAESLIY